MPTKLLRIPEVAAILNVTVQRTYELARQDLIPVVRMGRQLRVDPGKLQEWITNGGSCQHFRLGSQDGASIKRNVS